MVSRLLVLAAVLALAQGLEAATVIQKVQRINRQKITTITEVPDQDKVKGKAAPVDAAVQEVVMEAASWVCGRTFTDGDGRRWQLVSGSPLADKPNQLRGWLLTSEDGKLALFTRNGRLFRLTNGN